MNHRFIYVPLMATVTKAMNAVSEIGIMWTGRSKVSLTAIMPCQLHLRSVLGSSASLLERYQHSAARYWQHLHARFILQWSTTKMYSTCIRNYTAPNPVRA